MVEHISISAAEAAILTESARDSDGFVHLRRPYNGVWVGDIKMFRSLEQRGLMQFVDYQEVLPAKDRVRRSRITDAGRAALAELPPRLSIPRRLVEDPTWAASKRIAAAPPRFHLPG